MSNDAQPNELRYNRAEAARYERVRKMYKKAEAACAHLKSLCNGGKGTGGQYYNGFMCLLKNGLSDDFDFHSGRDGKSYQNGYRHDDGGDFCHERYFYGNMAGENENRQYNNARQADNNKDRHEKAAKAIEQEQRIRTLVTKERSLETVMAYYDSYYPSDPEDLDPSELDKEYPDWTPPPDIPLPQQLTGMKSPLETN